MAAYLRDHLVATSDSEGCTGTPTPPFLSLQPGMHQLEAYSYEICDTLLLSSVKSRVSSETFPAQHWIPLVVVPDKYETYTKYGSSNFISFQITCSLTCK